MTRLVTTLGPMNQAELGMILPHEHVFVDLRAPETPGFGEADVADVVRHRSPAIKAAQAVGVTAMVESTPVGVGRRVDILKALSEATDFPLVVATGIYREPWIPDWAKAASEDEIRDWMLRELTDQIEQTGVQAGWIKLSAGDDGITECETKILRAAAAAARATNAIIGSHTIRGRVVNDQLDIIEAAGYTAERFIWIHTQLEHDVEQHLAMARRGAWIEYDEIGNSPAADVYTEHIQRILDADLGDHLLLSHDRGWFDPGKPGGGEPPPYTFISQEFLPQLREAGVDDATITLLTHINPFRAFSR